MPETTHSKLVWGWLRLFLGVLQMFLASAAFAFVILIGFHPIALGLAAGATIATLISRVLYRGEPGYRLAQGNRSTKGTGLRE